MQITYNFEFPYKESCNRKIRWGKMIIPFVDAIISPIARNMHGCVYVCMHNHAARLGGGLGASPAEN